MKEILFYLTSGAVNEEALDRLPVDEVYRRANSMLGDRKKQADSR